MPIEEFLTWTCPYCRYTNNEYTDHRCFECHKKRPDPKTAKQIIAKRDRAEVKKQKQDKKKKIDKLDVFPSNDGNKWFFDTSKLKTD